MLVFIVVDRFKMITAKGRSNFAMTQDNSDKPKKIEIRFQSAFPSLKYGFQNTPIYPFSPSPIGLN